MGAATPLDVLRFRDAIGENAELVVPINNPAA